MGACCSNTEVEDGGDIERSEQLLREVTLLARVYGGDLRCARLVNRRCEVVWESLGAGVLEGDVEEEALTHQDLRASAVDMPHGNGSDVSCVHIKSAAALTAVHPLARKHMLVLHLSYTTRALLLGTLDLQAKALQAAPTLASITRIALSDNPSMARDDLTGTATSRVASEGAGTTPVLRSTSLPQFVGIGVGAEA